MSHQKQAIIFAFLAIICLTTANQCTSPLQGPGCYTLSSGLQSIVDAFTDFSSELESMVVDAVTDNEPVEEFNQEALYIIKNVRFGVYLTADGSSVVGGTGTKWQFNDEGNG